jgi:hypothetical protein
MPALECSDNANRWLARRYNVNNAWIFNGNNGTLNNNNVNNANRVAAVTNLLCHAMTHNMFSRQLANYFSTRRNKRYGRDQMAYEVSWVPLLVRDMQARVDRTFRIRHNYTFLVSRPKWREIFATEFAGRRADHEVCDVLLPLADRVLSPRSYNNRKGKGAQAAINQLIEDITEVSEGYTQQTWVIKIDLKGYFPSALWDYAEGCLQRLLNDYEGDDRDYLRWLTMVLVHANPAAYCELRTPKRMWGEHIEPSKSLLSKDPGEGAAIGRLIWQTAMGLYINDEVKWLNEECGLHVVCFVDDIVMILTDRLKPYALSLIPELRRRLAEKNIRLNEKKFYCQPIGHGVEFLGSHLKPYRIILNDETFGRALDVIAAYNRLPEGEKYDAIDRFIAVVNSYTGNLKNRTSRKRLQRIREAIGADWWQWLEWDEVRNCVVSKPEHTFRERINRKYHLRLKHHEARRKRKAA